MKQKLIEVKGEMDKSTYIVGDFKTPYLTIDFKEVETFALRI